MRIAWTSPALYDVRDINDWLMREASPAIAARMLNAVRNRALFLADFPHSGRPLPNGHRVLRVYNTPYLIRYRIMGEVAQVLRVHHERSDWQLEP